MSSDNTLMEVAPVIQFSPPSLLAAPTPAASASLSSALIPLGPVQVTAQGQLRKTIQHRNPSLFKPAITKSCLNSTVIFHNRNFH